MFDLSPSNFSTRWKIVLSIFTVLLIFVLQNQFSCRDTSPEGYEKAVNLIIYRKRADELCRSLPALSGTNLANRTVEGNDRIFAVSYNFTSEISISSVKEPYSRWAEDNGWQRREEEAFSFGKGSQIVDIYFDGTTSFSVHCSETLY